MTKELGLWHKWPNRLKLLPHISVSDDDEKLKAQLEVKLGDRMESATESTVRLKMLFNILKDTTRLKLVKGIWDTIPSPSYQ